MNDLLNEDWIDALLDDTDLPDLDLYDDSAPTEFAEDVRGDWS